MIQKLRYQAYRFKYRFGKHLPISVPVDVSLELSSDCNMKCVYCYHADDNKEKLPFTKGIMAKDVAFKILNEAAEIGVNAIKTNWKGESTINPAFCEITKHAKSLASGSTFIDRLTNSNFKFMSNREDIFEGLSYQTKVKVSYDSFLKPVFETQRAGGDHDKTTRNIDIFYNHPLRIKSDTRLVIQAVRTAANKDEDILGQAQKRWPSATISIRDMVAGRLEKDVSSLETRVRDESERQSCQQAHVRVLFNYDGKAFVCCPDIGEKLSIGDIKKQHLYEIFNSRAANEIRTDLMSGVAFESDPCKSCSSFETFKGFKPSWDS